jgi:hypothetical protein
MTRRRPCPGGAGPHWRGMRPGLMTCSARWRSGGDSASTWPAAGPAVPEQDADRADRGRSIRRSGEH